ncbi:SGNH/GDSL hydrolase family protein [Caulobacter segnis]
MTDLFTDVAADRIRAQKALMIPDVDATSYAIRASAAGYDLSSTEFDAVNLLCRRLKAGGVWGKIDEFWMLALGSSATYKLGGKRRSDLTANGTLTFTKNYGVRGDGSTGYLDTGINPTTFVGANWELNSASVGVFCNDPTVREGSAPNNNRLVGQGSGGGQLRLVARNSTNNATAGYINDATGTDAVSSQITVAPALMSIARLGSADKRIYNNRRQVAAFTTASTSVTNGNVMLLKDGTNYGSEQISFAYVAYGLRPAEVLAISDAVTEFLQSIMTPIGAWGDSMTFGPNGLGGPLTNPWPKLLQTALGRFVYNGGVSGETSTQIRQRLTSDDFLANGVVIVWAGKNDVSAPSTVLANAATDAAWNKTGKIIFPAITPTTGNDAAPGQPDYANRMTINAGLQAAYGPQYHDFLPALQAANDGSANDLADVAGGQIPRSLRLSGDSTHVSDTVNARGFSGTGVIAAELQAKMAALSY